MKKHYYINLAAVPFAKIYASNTKLDTLPKYWKEITEKEAKQHGRIETLPNMN